MPKSPCRAVQTMMLRLRVAPLRQSLLRRVVLLAPRPSASTVASLTQRLLVQKSRAIHTTRARLGAFKLSESSSDSSNEEPNSERDYGKMALNFALYMAPILLLVSLFDYYEDNLVSDIDPNRVAPSELVKASFTVVVQNELVASRLGDELFAYGDFDETGGELDHDSVIDSTSLRDECISHAQVEEDCWGPDRINATYTSAKIKYNVKGSKGRATVFARVQDDQKNGQYVYLIVTFVETGEVLEIIDNREELAV